MHTDRRRSGRTLLALVALLAGLAAAGAWNYQRNARLEEAAFRPFRGYADEDLAKLVGAYGSELEALRARQGAAPGRAAARDRGLLREQVDEFERVQRASSGARALAGAIAEREAALRYLEAEQERRARDRDRVAVFLRRLLGVAPG
jgi:hypothetical protein